MQARPLWYFFPLAFLLSWYTCYLRLFGVQTSGGMNPLGVLVAALIVAGACGGWSGTKALLLRIVRVARAAEASFALKAALLLAAVWALWHLGQRAAMHAAAPARRGRA